MPRVQLQFHANPEEAIQLGLRWAREHCLIAVAERFFPSYEAYEGADSASDLIQRLGSIDRVALCSQAPVVAAASAHDFTTKNVDCLFLVIGGRSDDGVRESALGGVTEDPGLLQTWRSLIRDAKAAMHAGATVWNPSSNRAGREPAHLHTPGAHELAEDGVPMLASAGWVEYEFDDCAQSSQKHAKQQSGRA